MKIGYLGPPGSFTQTAACRYFGEEKDHDYISAITIPRCLEEMEQGKVDCVVVPIENALEGTVNPALDYLYHKGALYVEKEIVMPIAQHLLIAHELTSTESICEVHSHHQALAQCQEYLQKNLPSAKPIVTDSTSAAARELALTHSSHVAVIGSKSCAAEYGLHIYAHDVHDNPYNKTRFWVLRQQQNRKQPIKKATICVTLPSNLPGALHKVLSVFAWRDLNLTKIESRPLKTNLGEYFFLIDIEVKPTDVGLYQMAVEEIQLIGGKVKEFGLYDTVEVLAE